MVATPLALPTVRPAQPGDVDAIIRADIAASALFEPTGLLTPEALSDHVAADGVLASIDSGNLDVALVPGAGVVGFVQYEPIDDDLYLQQISVDPAYGKRGIGRLLMGQLEGRAETLGLAQITLSTFRDLPWNGPFYASLGFTAVHRSEHAPYMSVIETAQAPFMDISKRVFMRKIIRKRPKRAK